MTGSLPTAERLVAAVPDSLPFDDVLSALADAERRQLLAVLDALETPERISALTRSLAAEMDRTGESAVERLYVRLYHVHVPKLADAGVVAYDPEAKTVELTEGGEPLAEAMSA